MKPTAYRSCSCSHLPDHLMGNCHCLRMTLRYPCACILCQNCGGVIYYCSQEHGDLGESATLSEAS